MLDSAEHEILNACKCKTIKKFGFFLVTDKPIMLYFLRIMLKCRQLSGKNFMLSCVEHEHFIISGLGLSSVKIKVLGQTSLRK